MPEGGSFNASLDLPADRPRTVSAYFKADHLDEQVYVGTNSGLWSVGENWLPEGEPSLTNAAFIPASKVVKIPATALAGSLTISNAAIISVNGATTSLLGRNADDTVRTDPVGLLLANDLTILSSGGLAIGGLDQMCPSYLDVGGDLVLSNSATIAVYAGYGSGTTWQDYKAGEAQVIVAGNTTLADTAVIYPYCHRKSGLGVVFDLQDLDIAVGASINASDHGFSLVGASYYGPSAPTGNNTGGSYGGRGGGGSKPVYGFPYGPYQPGSPGRGSAETQGMGGGAIRIQAHNISLTGKLLADGRYYYGFGDGAGSGGSVWVT